MAWLSMLHPAKRTAAVTVSLLCLTAVGTTGRAQDSPTPFEGLMTDMMPAQMLERNLANINGGNSRQPRRHFATVHANRFSTQSTANLVTTYTVSPAVTEKVKQQYIAWAKTSAPQDAAKLQQGLHTLDLEKTWAQSARDNGLKAGDMADSMAGYYLLNWAVANGRDANRAQASAVRNQFRTMLGKAPALQHATSAQRQEISETLMVNYLVQVDVYIAAVRTKNADLKARLGAAAAQRFQHDMGLDPRQLRVSNQGFVAKT